MSRKGVSTWFKINGLAVLVGVVGGLGAIVFRKMIEFFQYLFFQVLLPLLTLEVAGVNLGVALLPAIGGLIVGPIILRVAPETKGHGVPEVLEAVALKGGFIRTRVAMVKILVSSLTIGSGGSVGREGPIAQIGSSFGSALGQWFNLEESYRKLLVVCGLSAGISSTFMAPLGGALFGLEVIYRGVAPYDVIPVFISSVVGMFVTAEVFGMEQAFPVPTYRFTNPLEMAYFIPIGLGFGLLSIAWIRGLYLFEDFFEELEIPAWVKPAVGGLLTGLLGSLFLGYGILGVGYEGLEKAIAGEIPLRLMVLLGVLKLVSTGLTVGSGSSGGIFAPSLYIGGMLGGALGLAVEGWPFAASEPYVYALVGMAALFAGAARAPLTCIVMLPEMSGNYYLFPPLMLACASSYFISLLYQRESIYTLKLLRRGSNVDTTANPLKLVKVSEAMTPLEKVVSVRPETPLSVVTFMMWESEHTGFPVVGEEGYVGMLSFDHLAKMGEEEREALTAGEAALRDLPRVRPEDSVYEALELLNEAGSELLPVVGEGGRLVGVISDSDILQAFELGEQRMHILD